HRSAGGPDHEWRAAPGFGAQGPQLRREAPRCHRHSAPTQEYLPGDSGEAVTDLLGSQKRALGPPEDDRLPREHERKPSQRYRHQDSHLEKERRQVSRRPPTLGKEAGGGEWDDGDSGSKPGLEQIVAERDIQQLRDVARPQYRVNE